MLPYKAWTAACIWSSEGSPAHEALQILFPDLPIGQPGQHCLRTQCVESASSACKAQHMSGQSAAAWDQQAIRALLDSHAGTT